MDGILDGKVVRTAALEFKEGWRALLGATLGASIGIAALPFYTFGIFMRAIESEAHWRRPEIALAQTCWSIVLALTSPFVGGLIDRFGFRRPIAVSLASIACCFLLLGTIVRSPAFFVLVYTLMAAAGAASSPLPFAKLISGKFHRARGMALGITLAGTGIAALLAPLLLGPVIQNAGWRAGYLWLALAVAVLAPGCLWLIGRDTVAGDERRASVEAGASFSKAIRSLAFWQLAAIFFLVTFGASGLVAHLVPILTESGIAPSKAAAIVGIVGLSVMAGRLAIGTLLDLFQVRYVACVAFILTSTGCYLLLQFGASFAWTAAIGVGFALGTEVDLMGYCTGRYFGLRRYGSIYGTLYGFAILGVAASPLWMAVVSESYGYRPVLQAAVAITIASAALSSVLPRIDRRSDA
jgi:MFS family permease